MYKIPEPPPSEEDRQAMARGKPVLREDLKRFKKEYAQPVQLRYCNQEMLYQETNYQEMLYQEMLYQETYQELSAVLCFLSVVFALFLRVLNGIRHWVDNHFYDFERDKQLLKKLELFLSEVNGKAMRRWVESINKVINRKVCGRPLVTSDCWICVHYILVVFQSNYDVDSLAPEITFEKDPPVVEWYLTKDFEKFDILTVRNMSHNLYSYKVDLEPVSQSSQ